MKVKCCIMLIVFICTIGVQAQKILDHEVVLKNSRLMPWTEYHNIMLWSMNFLKYCPTYKTSFGDDPLYLVTSKLDVNGTFMYKQNNQGSNVFYGMKTFNYYYSYTGDLEALRPVENLIRRVSYYHTPAEWVWSDVPRTQDDSPDGEYTDEWGEVEKICMVAHGYIYYFKHTGKTEYLDKAENIAQTVLKYIRHGNELYSPLPFRVNFKTGEILDQYSSNMIAVIRFFDELIAMRESTIDKCSLKMNRDALWQWIMDYPMKNYFWSGYYEDVVSSYSNLNQQIPMETARYMLDNPEMNPDYKKHVPELIQWVENRFGLIKRFGATSVKEQDGCFQEMSSHTSRYASVVAKWFGVCLDEKVREEARASFALATYSAYNKHSRDQMGINYTGIEYIEPWFSDSYWDYLPHYFEGFAEMPEMLPENENHIFYSSSVLTDVKYCPERIYYKAYDNSGTERIKLTFKPKVYADGKPLSKKYWQFGDFRGVKNILIIKRNGVHQIEIKSL